MSNGRAVSSLAVKAKSTATDAPKTNKHSLLDDDHEDVNDRDGVDQSQQDGAPDKSMFSLAKPSPKFKLAGKLSGTD